MFRQFTVLSLLLLLLEIGASSLRAADAVTRICPAVGIQPRGADFQPGGIILTSFDKANLWVYNVSSNRRYPLPDTFPCGRNNCHISPDFRWLAYFNTRTDTFHKMRLDGTQRTILAENASDVAWWDADTLLVWTPGHGAFLKDEGSLTSQSLNVVGITTVQPGGYWGLLIEPDGDGFKRALVDLQLRGLNGIAEARIDLGRDVDYFDAAAWSPDGQWFAYVAPGTFDSEAGTAGGEIFAVNPGDTAWTEQWTDLTSAYGAVRINGVAVGDLSWSPDATHIAFWVTELVGPDPTANTGAASVHVLDVATKEVRAYCAFSTTEHTPNTPRLVWSPDSTHVAFGGNIPGDDKGYFIMALDVASGVFTTLSEGIYPTFGSADVIAWGYPPG